MGEPTLFKRLKCKKIQKEEVRRKKKSSMIFFAININDGSNKEKLKTVPYYK